MEKENPDKILVHDEGLFYRLYNKSAFWWYDNIKPFKLNHKFVKTIDGYLVSMGFPASKWDEYKNRIKSNWISEIKEVQESVFVFKCNNILNNEQVNERIKDMVQKSNTYSPKKNEIDGIIIDRVKTYPLANKTPFETMQFVAELQSMYKTKNQ
ncbi:MAG: hypothetical protein U9Q98_08615 [Bacteroidota bacterium]|nr:hypothetical protein [Bacteroidota bacterium]